MKEQPFFSYPEHRHACCCMGCVGLLLVLMACLWSLQAWEANSRDTSDHVEREVMSPDGKIVAAIVIRNTDSIAPSEGGDERVLLRRSDEAFLFDSHKHIQASSAYYDVYAYNVTVEWRDSRTLIVSADCYHGKPAQDTNTTYWGEVKINCRDCERH